MASSPTYDPNKFTHGIGHKDWEEIRDNPLKPIAESRYEVNLRGERVNKTVWFYEMGVVKSFENEPDDEILEVALVSYEDALSMLTHEEDKKILRYVFNK